MTAVARADTHQWDICVHALLDQCYNPAPLNGRSRGNANGRISIASCINSTHNCLGSCDAVGCLPWGGRESAWWSELCCATKFTTNSQAPSLTLLMRRSCAKRQPFFHLWFISLEFDCHLAIRRPKHVQRSLLRQVTTRSSRSVLQYDHGPR